MYTQIQNDTIKYIGPKPRTLKQLNSILIAILENEMGFKASSNQSLFEKENCYIAMSFGTETVIGIGNLILHIEPKISNVNISMLSTQTRYSLSFKKKCFFEFFLSTLKNHLIRYS